MSPSDQAEARGGGPEDGHDTSELLLQAVRGQSNISVGEIINGLSARAFGLAVLVFALPSCVPMPPGVPTLSASPC